MLSSYTFLLSSSACTLYTPYFLKANSSNSNCSLNFFFSTSASFWYLGNILYLKSGNYVILLFIYFSLNAFDFCNYYNYAFCYCLVGLAPDFRILFLSNSPNFYFTSRIFANFCYLYRFFFICWPTLYSYYILALTSSLN